MIDFHGNIQSHFSLKAISENCHLSTILNVELYINRLQDFVVVAFLLVGAIFHPSQPKIPPNPLNKQTDD